MPLSESQEDYLEAIFEIERSKRFVRVRDVAARLGVTMPSVNSALKHLEAKGLINHEKYEGIELTDTGHSHASRISRRHRMLFRFLRNVLGVDAGIADQDACKLEHDLSPVTVDKLTAFVGTLMKDNRE